MTALDFFDGPIRVFGNQRLGISGRARQCWQGGDITYISKRDADVAEKPASFAAQQGSSPKPFFESRLIERQQFDEIHLRQRGARMTPHEPALAGKPVPWAGCETVVATVNAVSNRPAKFNGN